MPRQYLRSKQAEQKTLFLLLAANIKVNVGVHNLVPESVKLKNQISSKV